MSDRLSLVLDLILPGDRARGWPAARAIGLAGKARDLAAGRGEPAVLDEIAARLPQNFERLGEAAQVAALAALEQSAADTFGRLIHYAYGAYYIDPAVRRVMEARTGYPARPPQPEGYHLPPFDVGLLDRVKKRAPFWRRVPKA